MRDQARRFAGSVRWAESFSFMAPAGQGLGYSYRNASIGSSRAARRAGQTPKKSPIPALNAVASTTTAGETKTSQPFRPASRFAVPTPPRFRPLHR